MISLWNESEAINLQQGNYLSSVTKLERIIENSNSVMSGFKLLQFTESTQSTLISSGENFKISHKQSEESISVYTVFFTLDYVVALPLKKNLILFVNFKPKINYFFILSFSAYFFILFFFFNRLSFNYYKSRNLFKRKFKLERTRAKKLSEKKIIDITTKLAHDIRSPLSTLALISNKIENHEARNLQASVIAQINQIASDLLINKKLTPQTSINLNTIKELSFVQLFEQLKAEYILKSTSNDQNIKFIMDPNLREIAVYAPNFLYASLNNLIQNSIEATAQINSASILLRTKIIGESILQIEIIDNGKGIPPQILEKLGKQKISFDKLQTTSGTGIGVFNTYNHIKQVGGDMHFESILNVKTIITLTLPIKLFS